jgi:hypothetical protein
LTPHHLHRQTYIALLLLVIAALAACQRGLSVFDARAFVGEHCGDILVFLPEHWVGR